jgi:hypothetical protein
VLVLAAIGAPEARAAAPPDTAPAPGDILGPIGPVPADSETPPPRDAGFPLGAAVGLCIGVLLMAYVLRRRRKEAAAPPASVEDGLLPPALPSPETPDAAFYMALLASLRHRAGPATGRTLTPRELARELDDEGVREACLRAEAVLYGRARAELPTRERDLAAVRAWLEGSP